MSSNYHTPYEDDSTQFKAEHMNVPLGELDAHIGTLYGYADEAIHVLASVNVDFSQTGNTTLYTTVSGEITIPMAAAVRAGEDCGNTQVKIGTPSFTGEFLETQTLSNLDSSGEVAILQPIPSATPPKRKAYYGSDTIQMTVVVADGGENNWVDLLGYTK